MQLEDRVDLDGGVLRQRAHADGRARVPTTLAPQRDVQLGCAVYHERNTRVAMLRLHEAAHAHAATDPLQVTFAGDAQCRQQVERAYPSRGAAIFEVDVDADAAGDLRPAVDLAGLACEEDKVARASKRHEAGDRPRRVG